MKKSISVNIKGTIFNIEEDAFESLKKYLDSIKSYFSSYDDSTEIYDDIEVRIAEILHEKLSKDKEVITTEDVENVISTMGKVEDFAEQEEEYQAENTESNSEYEPNFTTSSENANDKKRFYKDGKRKIISGVCSGIANYFCIDPFWIRLIFVLSPFFTAGTAIIIYIILAIILPENHDLGESNVKKLFRDGEDSVIGGVASGIAKYFGTDPVWVRILFVASFFLFGTGPFIYLVIWIITPEAKTRSEKMQMEGEPITISNIEKNIKENLNLKDEQGNESSLATILLFPFRLLAQILTGLGALVKPFSVFLLALIRFVGGFTFLSVGLSMLFTFFILLAVGIGLVSGNDVEIISNIPISSYSTAIPGYGMIAAFFAGFFPSLLFILLGLSLFAKRMLLKPLVLGAIFGFWIISLGFLIGTAAFVSKGFQEESKITKKEILPIADDEIILELNGNGSDVDNVELVIKTTRDTNIRLVQTVESRGSNIADAKESAKDVVYNYSIDENKITFDESIIFGENASYKFQNVTLELYVPYGKKIIINEDLRGLLNTYRTNSLPAISRKSLGIDLTERIWESQKKGIKCLNCEDILDEDEDFEDSDGEEKISPNKMSNTFELRGFSRIKLSDAFKVKITQSDNYLVKVYGSEDELDDVIAETDEDRLIISYDGKDFDENLLDAFDFDDSDRITVVIETPNLEEIDASGATDIKLKVTELPELTIDVSGATQLDLTSEKIDNLNLDVSGASQIEMEGKSEVFNLEVSGASKINALNLEANIVTADVSGASAVKVNVIERLQAETSGASHIRYKGNPKLDVDEDDFSNIKKY